MFLRDLYKIPYWKLDKEEVLRILNTNYNGISEKEVKIRKRKYGENIYVKKEQFLYLKLLSEEFADPFNIILSSAFILSYLIEEKLEAYLILLILIINIFISYFQKIKTIKTLEKIKERLSDKIRVIRDGKIKEIKIEDLVVGDIVILNEGERIPADIRILEEDNLYVDESTLTGESIPVRKTEEKIEKDDISIYEAKNILFSGTYVLKGTCKGVVIAVGRNTCFGKILKEVKETEEESIFRKNIKELSAEMIKIGYILLIITFTLLILGGFNLADAILFAIAISVGIVPENLPLIVNLTFAIFSQKLAKKGLLVKRLSAIEELGEIDVIVSDKTGTLTKNKIKLKEILTFTNEKKVLEYFLLASQVEYKKNFFGDPLEVEVAKCFKEKYGEKELLKILKKNREHIEFDYKFMRNGCKVDNIIIYKGAPEKILEDCECIEINEEIKNIKEYKEKLLKKLNDMFKEGLRVLGLMYIKENKKIFLGFFSYFDEIKESAKETIEELKNLGVEVKIITGDNKKVALAVAKKVGLDISEKDVIEGEELRKLSYNKFLKVLKEKKIFARVTPELKGEIVEGLKKLGYKVAAVGDGINDLVMIKKAHLGISVENAEDILKDNSDIILLRKDLSIILEGIKLGRISFRNIKNYLLYTLAGNLGEVLYIVIAVLLLKILPLRPIHVLTINILTDSFPAFVLLKSEEKFDLFKPSKWNIKKIFDASIKISLLEELFGIIILLYLLFNKLLEKLLIWSTMFFHEIIFETVVFLSLISKKKLFSLEYNWDKSRIFAILFILSISLLIIYKLNKIFDLKPLPGNILLLIVILSIIYGIIVDTLKERILY